MKILDAYRDTYRGLGAGVWRIAAVTFVHRAGTMVLPFLALFLTEKLGTSAREAGGVLALYGLGSLAGAWAGGRWSDRFGARTAMTISLLGAGVGLELLQWLDDVRVFAVAIVPTAMMAESFRPASAAALAHLARPDNRARVFALRRLAINAGMSVGPAVGGWLAVVDWSWLFRIDGATCFCAAILLRWLIPTDPETVIEEEGVGVVAVPSAPSVWTDRPYLLLLVALAFLSTIFFQLMSTWPLTMRDHHGLDEPRIGLLFAVNTLLIVIAEMPLVGAFERRSPLLVAAGGAFFVAVGLGVLPWVAGFDLLVGTMVLVTIGEMLLFPALESLAAGRAPVARRGQYLGLYTACFSFSFLIGPLAGTWIYEQWGSDTLWVLVGVGGCLLGGMLIGLDRSGLLNEASEASSTSGE